MKYSKLCLEQAIQTIFPDSPKWPKTIGIPTLINMAACQIFMHPELFGDIKSAVATLVLRVSMLELSDVGWIEFGQENPFHEMNVK